MQLVDYFEIVGIIASITFGCIALRKSSKANKISEEANTHSKSAAETAEMAFRYSTGMVWQLAGYEQKQYTESHKLPLPLAGDVYLALSALGADAVKDVSIEFSYDPYGVLVRNRSWMHYDPKSDQRLIVKSGLKASRFMSAQRVEGAHAIVRWTDVANKKRDFIIDLKTVQFPNDELVIPENFPED